MTIISFEWRITVWEVSLIMRVQGEYARVCIELFDRKSLSTDSLPNRPWLEMSLRFSDSNTINSKYVCLWNLKIHFWGSVRVNRINSSRSFRVSISIRIRLILTHVQIYGRRQLSRVWSRGAINNISWWLFNHYYMTIYSARLIYMTRICVDVLLTDVFRAINM